VFIVIINPIVKCHFAHQSFGNFNPRSIHYRTPGLSGYKANQFIFRQPPDQKVFTHQVFALDIRLLNPNRPSSLFPSPGLPLAFSFRLVLLSLISLTSTFACPLRNSFLRTIRDAFELPSPSPSRPLRPGDLLFGPDLSQKEGRAKTRLFFYLRTPGSSFPSSRAQDASPNSLRHSVIDSSRNRARQIDRKEVSVTGNKEATHAHSPGDRGPNPNLSALSSTLLPFVLLPPDAIPFGLPEAHVQDKPSGKSARFTLKLPVASISFHLVRTISRRLVSYIDS